MSDETRVDIEPSPDETVTISRARLEEALRTLLIRLPDLLEENAGDMPLMARASLPVIRLMLSGDAMQETLTGSAVSSYVWAALVSCQTD